MKKYAFITGANKGIGYELVRQLAEKNYHVFLGARNEQLGQQAVDSLNVSNVSYIQVDISNSQSIQEATKKIHETTDHLHLLINNAGIALDFNTLPSELNIETLRQGFEVNFFGTFQMIQAFLPLLKNSSNSKILNVTTDMASLTMFANGETHPINTLGYNSSKTAINALTLAFSKEFATNGPEVFGITPGFTTTDLNGNSTGGHTTIESAKIIIKYALSETNYNGKILNKNGIIPW
ncbi:SDR family NAD(P)-dependent oxidoreductase [Bacillus thuringiensis]|uniref:Short-chain dehydrogenase n=1 Tax=Bacillus thuringiensis serovar toumanoffi TaxID=180862 RepID=A0ABD5HXM3_BACTU|nr:SDR family NAD(P)-dependent oxidoreductase [Bacillus thuringiensis]EEM97107.1 Short chain dehydrogenase [Bacillus thuringiensis IBL 200]MCR6779687.1 SDR family NAD(P)-dependent oxidoreductase [Bacillus thuringiensis]MCR6857756.1 SDR family NAD(P)-dependent oxidoreductase [Bacillus thuringiensis]MCR6867028.1 SDR family NAD(P)-dependent oxidoreductase [Bacillus thuringiensis]MDW9209709.1 short-chain dehydrogenase [Bacillus thuringiensis serovar toumanoffi]